MPAEPHGRVEHAGQAENVEHREDRDPDVVIFEAEQLAGHGAVHVQLEMGELGAFGLAGGPAGVDDHRGVVGAGGLDLAGVVGEVELVEVPGALGPGVVAGQGHHVRGHVPGLPGARDRLRGETLEGDQQPGPGILQLVGDLGRFQQRVQRHHDQAGLEDGEVAEQELGQVRQLHGHPVAPAQPGPEQGAGYPPGNLVNLGIAEGQVADVAERVAGLGGTGLAQHGGQVEAHGAPVTDG